MFLKILNPAYCRIPMSAQYAVYKNFATHTHWTWSLKHCFGAGYFIIVSAVAVLFSMNAFAYTDRELTDAEKAFYGAVDGAAERTKEAQEYFDDAVKYYYWEQRSDRQVTDLLVKAAQLGHPVAKMEMAKHYWLGSILPKDKSKARELANHYRNFRVEKVTKRSLHVLYLVGWMHSNIFGDIDGAAKYYELAARQYRYAPALNNLGLIHYEMGGQEHNTFAFKIWRMAADQGFPTALYNLGLLHRDRTDNEDRYSQAAAYFHKAGKAGERNAPTALARLLYEGGKGLPQNHEKAHEIFKAVAEDYDDKVAQYYLGKMYAKGQGVERDDRLAIRWYKKAAQNGHQGAKKVLVEAGEAAYAIE